MCEPLCGSIPIITAITAPFRPTDVRTAVGMSDIRVRHSRLFRATPRRHPDAGTSLRSQAAHGRQTVREPDVRMSRRYEPAAPPWWILNQTAKCANRRLLQAKGCRRPSSTAMPFMYAPRRVHRRRSVRGVLMWNGLSSASRVVGRVVLGASNRRFGACVLLSRRRGLGVKGGAPAGRSPRTNDP